MRRSEAAVTHSNVPEGLFGLRGRTTSKETFFPEYFVNGTRLRAGAEFSWMPGPFALKAEYITVREQRLGQGLREEDIPDLLERGWYVYGTWVVTGQNKEKGLARGRRLPFHRQASSWGGGTRGPRRVPQICQ